jgi:hypothetical protein
LTTQSRKKCVKLGLQQSEQNSTAHSNSNHTGWSASATAA